MIRQLSSRLIQLVMVAWVVSTLCFVLLHSLPGDPAMRIAAGRYGPDGMSAAAAEHVRQELGLNAPIWLQYVQSLSELLQGKLGFSLVTGESVLSAIEHELGHTLLLALCAWVLSLLMAIPIGLLSGWQAGSKTDQGLLAISVLLRSVPPFIIALFLMWLFSFYLGWLPAAGSGSLAHLVLPSLTLALGLAAISNRVLRNAVATVRQQSYFRFARYKGLSNALLLRNHTLRNASIPLVTYLAFQLIYLIEGVVVVESLFAYPGIGHALVHAIIDRDVPMLQGTVLVMSILFVLISAVSDLLITKINPLLGARHAQ